MCTPALVRARVRVCVRQISVQRTQPFRLRSWTCTTPSGEPFSLRPLTCWRWWVWCFKAPHSVTPVRTKLVGSKKASSCFPSWRPELRRGCGGQRSGLGQQVPPETRTVIGAHHQRYTPSYPSSAPRVPATRETKALLSAFVHYRRVIKEIAIDWLFVKRGLITVAPQDTSWARTSSTPAPSTPGPPSSHPGTERPPTSCIPTAP